jgi:hypothetical protein
MGVRRWGVEALSTCIVLEVSFVGVSREYDSMSGAVGHGAAGGKHAGVHADSASALCSF